MPETADSTDTIIDPIKEVLVNRKEPVNVTHQETVRDALVKMVENDFSQLPVVDEENNLTGIISEQTISRQYYHLDNALSLLDLTVDHCQEDAITLSIEDANLFEILERLENNYAVVITSGRKPVGIITDYDTTHFFRDWSEGLIRIQNIELTLRKYIDSLLSEKKLAAALMRAFGADKKEPHLPRKLYHDLSFHDHINLIVEETNWKIFEPYLKPKGLFISNMEPVNKARNQLAHFRGRIDAIQHDQIQRAQKWLASRPKIKQKSEDIVHQVEVIPALQQSAKGKYGPLEEWLTKKAASAEVSPGYRIQLSFPEIEAIIGDTLPNSAREQNAWWANDSTSLSRHSMAWLRPGWRVDDFDLDSEIVVFQRTNSVLYQLFFAELLTLLKERRPSLTRATKTFPQNWWNFSAGRSGFYLGWAFGNDNKLRTELYIDVGDKEKNKYIIDKLYEQKEEIESEIGKSLTWSRMNDARASRIFVSRHGSIASLDSEVEELKQWSMDNMLRFVDAFQTRIKEL